MPPTEAFDPFVGGEGPGGEVQVAGARHHHAAVRSQRDVQGVADLPGVEVGLADEGALEEQVGRTGQQVQLVPAYRLGDKKGADIQLRRAVIAVGAFQGMFLDRNGMRLSIAGNGIGRIDEQCEQRGLSADVRVDHAAGDVAIGRRHTVDIQIAVLGFVLRVRWRDCLAVCRSRHPLDVLFADHRGGTCIPLDQGLFVRYDLHGGKLDHVLLERDIHGFLCDGRGQFGIADVVEGERSPLCRHGNGVVAVHVARRSQQHGTIGTLQHHVHEGEGFARTCIAYDARALRERQGRMHRCGGSQRAACCQGRGATRPFQAKRISYPVRPRKVRCAHPSSPRRCSGTPVPCRPVPRARPPRERVDHTAGSIRHCSPHNVG